MAISRATRRSRSGSSRIPKSPWSASTTSPAGKSMRRLKARAGAPRVVAVSGAASPLADIWVEEHRLMARGEAAPLVDLARARALRGAHNAQNAAFAYAAARTLGVEREQIARAFETFPGLAHRMEEVGSPRPGSVHQRLEGDQRRRGREGAAVVPRHPLDRRAAGRRRAASSRCARCFRASPRPT